MTTAEPSVASERELRFARRVMLPVASAVIAMTLGVVGLILWTGVEQDRMAIEAGRKLAAGAIAARAADVARQANDYAYWDEAFERLHEAFDGDWADANIGAWLSDSFGVDLSFVIGHDGATLYAMVDGERVATSLAAELGAEVAGLLAASRAGPIDAAPATGIVRVGDALGVVAVAGVRRQSDGFALDGPARTLLVLVDRLDRAALGALGERYLLRELRLSPARPAPPAALPLELADGRSGGSLVWTPEQPGRALWQRVLPVLAVAVSMLGAFVAVVLAHSRKAAEEIAESEARARHMALHDPLTGLPNRVLLSDRIDQALARLGREGGRIAVHYLDLDGFKGVNDVRGHASGDQLLRIVGARLLGVLRQTDTVARLGGDEFAILQCGIAGTADAENLARRVLTTIAEPFSIDDQAVRVGVSIGIAVAPDDGVDYDLLARRADIALYKAKQGGRGTYCFFEAALDATLSRRRALEHDLRHALAAGQMEVHYQPQIDVRTGDLVGVEALIRWRHPERGVISPAEFIPLAEETGLIREIGAWILRRACADAARWPKLRVSVNISAAQFRDPDLVETVRAVLRDSGLPPRRLELELTESALFNDPDKAAAMLEALRALGVSLAMDDFGTGYSSLSQLHRLPFDTLKIDQGFIARLGEDESSTTIVRAVLGMSRGLGVQAVAEGIETPAQLAFIAEEGCDVAQGFHLGRPVPASDIDALVRTHHRPPTDMAPDGTPRHPRRHGTGAVPAAAPAAV